MTATLKPEKERIVTPGPKAVEDLQSLPKALQRGGEFTLHQLVCQDADGKVFERYDTLHMDTDWFQKNDEPLNWHFGEALAETQDTKTFVPSFALHCNILLTLWDIVHQSAAFDDRKETARQLLHQYMDPGIGVNTNTVYDTQENEILHYPSLSRLPIYVLRNNLRNDVGQRSNHSGEFMAKGYMFLETMVKYESGAQLLRNLTGLPDPTKLGQVAEFLGLCPIFRDFRGTDDDHRNPSRYFAPKLSIRESSEGPLLVLDFDSHYGTRALTRRVRLG